MSQFWCSFITFPLYVIITQMGSRFKKTVISDNVRKSLTGWQRRVKARHAMSHSTSTPLLSAATTSSDSLVIESTHNSFDFASTSTEGSSSGTHNKNFPHRKTEDQTYEIVLRGDIEESQFPSNYDSNSNDNEIRHRSVNSNDVISP